MCPESEVEEIQKNNPNTEVIGYKGNDVDGYADAFLSMIGYRYESVGKHSWVFSEEQAKQTRFRETNGLPIGWHAGSIEAHIENLLEKYNKIIGFINSLNECYDNGKI